MHCSSVQLSVVGILRRVSAHGEMSRTDKRVCSWKDKKIPWLAMSLDKTNTFRTLTSYTLPPIQKLARANNFLFSLVSTVVGAEEAKSRTVNIRNRDDQATQAKGELIPLQEALDHMVKLKDERRLINKF